mmetsp:Transcript_13623/g.41456  ORF Transcript_13623/g.41456 Transcript_13623/m.41456 type:complete len:224 (-) Transcript_13623:372-1043(-)
MAAEALRKLCGNLVSNVSIVLTRPPPPIWDPTMVTIRRWTERFKQVWRTQGLATAYNKLRMENQLRAGGQLVGTDANGNRYFEDLNAPYGRTRWVEYPTVKGTWALEDKFDASMIHPDWHGWIHYMHDIPGDKVALQHSKPFKQHHRVNQTMLRPYYTTPAGFTSKHFEEGQPAAYHTPPGAMDNKKPRGRLGPKYSSWDPSGQTAKNELRNYADNTKILGLP